MDFDKGLMLTEIADGVSVEDIRAATKSMFKVCMVVCYVRYSVVTCYRPLMQVSDNLIAMKQAGQ